MVIKKNKIAFCSHPETGFVNKLLTVEKMKKTKFNLVFDNNLEYGRWDLGVKHKGLLLFRRTIKNNVHVNTYEIPDGDIQQACVWRNLTGERPWLAVQVWGSSECRLLKPKNG